jgi:tetratricopeptide (TPR) repeat protein
MNAMGLGRLAVTSLAFAALVIAPGLAAADDAADCAKETGEDAIAACTRRIESGEVRGHELAVMFGHRGLAARRKGDIDRAIADFDEAIRLDPNFAQPVFRRAMVWAYNKNEVAAPLPTSIRPSSWTRAPPMRSSSAAVSMATRSAITTAPSPTLARHSVSTPNLPRRSTIAASNTC